MFNLRNFFFPLLIFFLSMVHVQALEDQGASSIKSELSGQERAALALADIEQDIQLSQQQMQEVAQEIESLKKDEKSLSEALVSSVAKSRQLDKRLNESGQRLSSLLTQKTATQNLLQQRHEEVTSALAVLERMGLRPPPTILAHPRDALRSLRSASLLKSVMVEGQARLRTVRSDLEKIERIESLINNEKAQIEANLQQAQIEKQRLYLLLDEKKNAQQLSNQQLTQLQEQTDILAQKAQSLSELIETLEAEQSVPQEDEASKTALLPIDDHFANQRGHLPLPVVGVKMQAFAQEKQDDFHGELYETSQGVLVTTPVDAMVRYAGSFRSYGQLLILDVGENYHLVLAGMGQIHVQQGQLLLAGEPVGTMSTSQLTDEQEVRAQAAPMLYVELRKDGTPIDPAPWWAGSS